jgi:hypothetical protein
MAAPNIVSVATITGVTTAIAGVSTENIQESNKWVGVTTVVVNAAASGKVIKINSLVVASIGTTTGATVNVYDTAGTHLSAGATVSIATTISVPTNSSLAILDKSNGIYLEENKQLGIIAQSNAGTLDVVCSYEEIS